MKIFILVVAIRLRRTILIGQTQTGEHEMRTATDQIKRLYMFASEDRDAAYAAADLGDWDTYDGLINCAHVHEDNARRLSTAFTNQYRPS